MKKIIQTFYLFLTVFTVTVISCQKDSNEENHIFFGSWLFVQVDSCRRYVYPNASVFRINIANSEGVIEFHNDGNGVLN